MSCHGMAASVGIDPEQGMAVPALTGSRSVKPTRPKANTKIASSMTGKA